MKKTTVYCMSAMALLFFFFTACGRQSPDNPSGSDSKMSWWNESRFGMFIHWGLYSIPAGEWNGDPNHAEWIRTTARIPLEVYDTLVNHFNPVKFNADEWVKAAKEAGMKYIVITSKHHDGFCLFDSDYTDFDVMSTPFKRDILGELAEACHRQGVVLCFYHSIMDWHHPDYLPRRDWEITRSAEGADMDRFVTYLKNQLKELTTKYGAIGVLWFDGEWEDTWTHDRGIDLYNYVISLQDEIIVNNRVDKGRAGMQGMTTSSEFKGDFGTPEQEVPATGFPGVSWESCITLNDHWGFNRADNNWKSSGSVIRMLADIASKGGNLLLNIGPKADGTFPEQSILVLSEVGKWMAVNSEAVYGTSASPFKKLDWGRCTGKTEGKNSILYLHVFDWPENGRLLIPGLASDVKKAWMLDGRKKLRFSREEADIVVEVPETAPDSINTVIVMELAGEPVIYEAPELYPSSCDFVGSIDITAGEIPAGLQLLYTIDGSDPLTNSPVFSGPETFSSDVSIKAAYFREGKRITNVSVSNYRKVVPVQGGEAHIKGNGLEFTYIEGEFDLMPDFGEMKAVKKGVVDEVMIIESARPEDFALRFSGFINIPADGIYTFWLDSDDGSLMFLNGEKIINNDGLHGAVKKKAERALGYGIHSVEIQYFQKKGGKVLSLEITGPEGKADPHPLFVH